MTIFAKTIVTPFVNAGVPATGLSPVIDIWNANTGAVVVAGAAMAEIAGGWYRYVFATFDDSLNYAIRMDGGAGLPIPNRYTFAANESEDITTIRVDGVEAGIAAGGLTPARAAMIELSKKILVNRLELADGNSSNWILYDDDDTTPLLTWDVADKTGSVIQQPTLAPSRRTRGT